MSTPWFNSDNTDDEIVDNIPDEQVVDPEPEEEATEEEVGEKPKQAKTRRTKKKPVFDRKTLLEVSKKAIQLKEADETALSYLALELGSKSEDPADLAVEAVVSTDDGILADVYSFYGQDQFDVLLELFGKSDEERRDLWTGCKKLGLVEGRSLPSKPQEAGKALVDAMESIDEDTADAIKRAIDLK